MKQNSPGGKVAELAANIIAESIYAQQDVNGNKDLLFKWFSEHRKDDPALTVEDQNLC